MQTFMEGSEEDRSEEMDVENTLCMEKNSTLVGPDARQEQKQLLIGVRRNCEWAGK